jgi:hypothetical protein
MGRVGCFIRGDANADSAPAETKIDLTDVIFILLHLFLGGAAPPCEDAANVDGQAPIDMSDAIFLLNHLFRGGEPPPDPYPECGCVDLKLGCESFPPCP